MQSTTNENTQINSSKQLETGDLGVLTSIDEGKNLQYGNAIIRVLELGGNINRLIGTTSMVMNSSEMKRRIIMISNYKKVNIKSILLGAIIVFMIGGIAIALNTSKSKLKAETPVVIAEEFVRNIYTVDAKKVDEYNKLLLTPREGAIGEGVPEGGITGPGEEYTKIAHSFDKNIQPLMTKEGYEAITANSFNLKISNICVKGNYTSQITDLTLGKNIYGENKDKVRYYYEAKLKFIPNDGKFEQADVSKGVIELLKENGKWKVWLYNITQLPKLYN